MRDRRIFDAIYFEDPLGLLIEISCYKFEPPAGFTHADVLFEAHKLRVAAAIERSAKSTSPTPSRRWSPARQQSLSSDRSAKDPYHR